MISGITITCFAASYALAWVMELARGVWRKKVPLVATLAMGLAGLLAHTLHLWHRASVATESPLSSWYDWYLLASWTLALLYVYLAWIHPRNPIGLFLLPGVLSLIGVAALTGSRAPLAQADAARIWGTLHGVFLLLGTVAVLVGFLFGLMYLWQARRLKRHSLPSEGFRLPSLEWLQRTNERSILASVFLLLVGFLAGVVTALVQRGPLQWTDPVVWSSGLLAAWMTAAAVFQAIYRPAREGRKVAYLTTFSFLFLILTLIVIKLTDPTHGSTRETESDQPSAFKNPRSQTPAWERAAPKAPATRASLFPIAHAWPTLNEAGASHAGRSQAEPGNEKHSPPLSTQHSSFIILPSPSFSLPTGGVS